ncbi:hypothetical protein BV22DRAFT_1034752 [Leucogyrophana mollusca]|uniref:Uncharacterized protein n=1 Tax=Leucogyrophana mollusca TaxID=85980 RepID=A0ACB8BG63_9AGAM|nr:hypothetical protein BV22DRAFT_1034752 [Leucogyrophana mollusca]
MSALEGQPNGINSDETRIEVNQRALVDKILARYPEEFTVFRELLQNADDARATSVEIHFRTENPSEGSAGANGKAGEVLPDLKNTHVRTWIVRNNGDPFDEKGWARLTKIADGNPDEGKIGAFGVGFYSVFSVTDEPTVTSGVGKKTIFYKGDQLWVKHQRNTGENDPWTTIEMKLRKPAPCPKPFDLTRFLTSSMTFMVNMNVATVYFDDKVLSVVRKDRSPAKQLPVPPHFVTSTPLRNMKITGVEVTAQRIQAEFMQWIYSAGTSKPHASRALLDSDSTNPTKSNSFWDTPKPPKKTRTLTLPPPTPTTGNISYCATYSVYSATADVTPSEEMLDGLRSATLKDLPSSLKYDMVHFSKDEYDKRAEEDKSNPGTGSIFRGPQGLCPELHGEYAARVFIGHSTSQTTGIGGHMASRFIPTVERGAIDLANGEVAKWNEELLYVGGFLARLVYERELEKVRVAWPMNKGVAQRTGPEVELPFAEGLYTMKCFTFRGSTPDAKVASHLMDAFFSCSDSDDFPIISNAGVRPTKDVRIPHSDFIDFMRELPVLPSELYITPTDSQSGKISMIPHLPPHYQVGSYKFRDVLAELGLRIFQPEEMTPCIKWWVATFQRTLEDDEDRLMRARERFAVQARTRLPRDSSGKVLRLDSIRLFVDTRGTGSFISPDDPLPENTIPLYFTNQLTPDAIRTALGWKEMTAVDWIRYLVDPDLPPAHNIRTNHGWAEHVLTALTSLRGGIRVWSSLSTEDRDEIKKLMEVVPCIPTNKGIQLPDNAFFPAADVFKDLPTVRLPPLNEEYGKMLEELGVRKFLDLRELFDRAAKTTGWTNYDMLRYLVTVPSLEEDMDLIRDADVFACETQLRHTISDLYEPQATFRALQLPVLDWPSQNFTPAEEKLLSELGLRKYPPLEEIISLASSTDPVVRDAALNYFFEKQDEHYDHYEPADFADKAFIPALSREGTSCVGTPEEVFTDAAWTIMGFHKVHETVDKKKAQKLKIQKRPLASSVIALLEKSPPKDKNTAREWFDFLAKNGGFTSEDLQKVSTIPIVPVEDAVLHTDPSASDTPPIRLLPPEQCFLSSAEKPKDHFYSRLFTFIDFGKHANEFLKICGAKAHPACVDIAYTLLKDPRRFLEVAGEEEYRKELYQVALQRSALPDDVEERMRDSPLFLGYRRRSQNTPEPEVETSSPEPTLECDLKRADEIVIADDLESHRLFGDRVFSAPQDDRLEEFYAHMGSKPLSASVDQTVKPHNPCPDSEMSEDLRNLILKRIRLFLYGNKSSLKPDHPFVGLDAGVKFSVRTCEGLEITKTLKVEEKSYASPVDASVGVKELPKENRTELWLIDNGRGSKPDMYDIATALCRVVLEKPKAHDALLLMTMLDTDIDTLKRRGYDVDRIEKEHEKAVAAALAEKKAKEEADNAGDDRARQSRSMMLLWFFRPFTYRIPMRRTGRSSRAVTVANLDSSIDEVMKMCSGEGQDMPVLRNREHSAGGKKKRDVDYCTQRKMTNIKECPCSPVRGVKVFQPENSQSTPPIASMERFVSVVIRLAEKVFNLPLDAFHVFYAPSDPSLMGFNRNHGAIYLNLAHYEKEHDEYVQSGQRTVALIAWYFIIAHEVAHNKLDYHDEKHELLFSALSQKYLLNLLPLLKL